MTVIDEPITDTHDLIEQYFDQPWSDGLPVAPPTERLVQEMVDALGGDPDHLEARVPPRWGSLTTRTLAVNMVMAGCKPAYAPVARSSATPSRAECSPWTADGPQSASSIGSSTASAASPCRAPGSPRDARISTRQTAQG